MNCPNCRNKMKKKTDNTPEGVSFTYFKCDKCGEEILDLKQLHAVAEKYREMKKYTAKISKWGESLAVRIPKPLTKKYSLKANTEVTLVPEKNAIKILS
ncbi:AbrB/MazE/SpoVT family DNA-binding domain-containing protein [Candidatus Micrarchaeota archaeon]|nr:AbrB/MazE/SpoVT family DNA-binding domain-containing protein [Candidatus Micrarchaeota archaeon]MBU2477287.1 AbrB/MazE/SpoVT family DNA-binding domain-containing protein [Candidatus Micrarchaeota archaeon]